MDSSFGSQSMVAPLRRVIVKRPEEAFGTSETIEKEWKALNYTRKPDLHRAGRDHAEFVSLLAGAGAEILYLPADERTGLDSLYTHDPVLMTDAGAILLQTGKRARRGEGPAFGNALKAWGIPIMGVVGGEATAEAGDMVWLDKRTLAVGRGFRSNAHGIEALSALLKPLGVEVIPVELPYRNGPDDVLHLMSFISLVDDDLAVVYRRLLPVPFFELLNSRSIKLIDVPDEEYESLGCNILAISPRSVVMAKGNPITSERLKTAGCTVAEFDGDEICLPGSGGPTCLTRPLWRAALHKG